jgi:hypothetical protein
LFLIFNNTNRDIQDLNQHLDQAKNHINPLNNEQTTLPRVQSKNDQAVPRVHEVPRVQSSKSAAPVSHNTTNQRITRAAAAKTKARRRAQNQPTKSSIQHNMKQALSAQLHSPAGHNEFIRQYKER